MVRLDAGPSLQSTYHLHISNHIVLQPQRHHWHGTRLNFFRDSRKSNSASLKGPTANHRVHLRSPNLSVASRDFLKINVNEEETGDDSNGYLLFNSFGVRNCAKRYELR